MPLTIQNLLDHGFKAPRSGIAASAQEAVDLANSIGYPVVMKIESPDILHKTDVGGVALGVKDAAAVEAAFGEILTNVRAKLPDVPVSQVRVEEMCSGGIEVIIAGAGMSAHLPGVLASWTTLPVIGVPLPAGELRGVDALLSIIQMPGGIPVACVAIGGAKNAALLAAQILGLKYPEIGTALEGYRQKMAKD